MVRRVLVPLALAAVAASGFSASVLASAQRTTVALRPTSLGRVLVGANGHTLYRFLRDTTKASTCSGACAASWPPLVVSGKPVAGAGLRQSLLGTTRRADGRLQVTYAGHPLYFFSGDASVGQAKGEGLSAFGARWYAVAASGAIVKSSSSGSTATTTSPTYSTPVDTSTGGYGP